MSIVEILKLFGQYGFGAVAMAAILFASWKLLEWGKGIVDKAMQQVEVERTRSDEVYRKFATVIDEHTLQAKEFHTEVRSAHNYQREEHRQCLDSINTVCNNIVLMADANKTFKDFVYESLEDRKEENKKMLAALEVVADNLKEVTTTLGRINGYKHE